MEFPNEFSPNDNSNNASGLIFRKPSGSGSDARVFEEYGTHIRRRFAFTCHLTHQRVGQTCCHTAPVHSQLSFTQCQDLVRKLLEPRLFFHGTCGRKLCRTSSRTSGETCSTCCALRGGIARSSCIMLTHQRSFNTETHSVTFVSAWSCRMFVGACERSFGYNIHEMHSCAPHWDTETYNKHLHMRAPTLTISTFITIYAIIDLQAQTSEA